MQNLIQTCKQKLSYLELLPVKPHTNGLIMVHPEIFSYPNSWCLDSRNRSVILLNRTILLEFSQGTLMQSDDGYSYSIISNVNLSKLQQIVNSL